jgi:hypothetical protein
MAPGGKPPVPAASLNSREALALLVVLLAGCLPGSDTNGEIPDSGINGVLADVRLDGVERQTFPNVDDAGQPVFSGGDFEADLRTGNSTGQFQFNQTTGQVAIIFPQTLRGENLRNTHLALEFYFDAHSTLGLPPDSPLGWQPRLLNMRTVTPEQAMLGIGCTTHEEFRLLAGCPDDLRNGIPVGVQDFHLVISKVYDRGLVPFASFDWPTAARDAGSDAMIDADNDAAVADDAGDAAVEPQRLLPDEIGSIMGIYNQPRLFNIPDEAHATNDTLAFQLSTSFWAHAGNLSGTLLEPTADGGMQLVDTYHNGLRVRIIRVDQ